jgi:hypothetical protein
VSDSTSQHDDLRRRALWITVEALAIAATAIIPLPVPAQIPLLSVASISLWVRGGSWSPRFATNRLRVVVGIAVGAAALALAFGVIGPALEAGAGAMIVWTQWGVVRGNVAAAIPVAIVVAALVVATEMILRGWIVERVLELASGWPGRIAAVAIAAGIEAIFLATPENAFGAMLFGAALGSIYLSSGRSLVAPIAARLVFELGIVVLEVARIA